MSQAAFQYASWRFLLWSRGVPHINSYNAIDFWVERGVLKPGEFPERAEMERRVHEWYADPNKERAFQQAKNAPTPVG